VNLKSFFAASRQKVAFCHLTLGYDYFNFLFFLLPKLSFSNKKTFRYPKAVFSNKKLLLSSQFLSFINSGTIKIFKKTKTGIFNLHWFFLKTTKKSINIDYPSELMLFFGTYMLAAKSFVRISYDKGYFFSLLYFASRLRLESKNSSKKYPLSYSDTKIAILFFLMY
jgi:hypothetical protein